VLRDASTRTTSRSPRTMQGHLLGDDTRVLPDRFEMRPTTGASTASVSPANQPRSASWFVTKIGQLHKPT
jgi:hypothetical protein